VCRLCDGYFRDAHTIVECMHTFCKSCLLREFHTRQNKATCPHCKMALAANPLNSIIADHTMQEVVDKIFPEMAERDDAAKVAFYDERGIALQEQHRARDAEGLGGAAGGGAGAQQAAPPKRKKKSTDEDEAISFKLAPDTGDGTPPGMVLQTLDKPFLRTSGKLKVVHLKKYLMKKLALPSIGGIEILCKSETLGPELSLIFISKSRWLDPEHDLELNYRGCEEQT